MNNVVKEVALGIAVVLLSFVALATFFYIWGEFGVMWVLVYCLVLGMCTAVPRNIAKLRRVFQEERNRTRRNRY
jgi:hypothetical protein